MLLKSKYLIAYLSLKNNCSKLAAPDSLIESEVFFLLKKGELIDGAL